MKALLILLLLSFTFHTMAQGLVINNAPRSLMPFAQFLREQNVYSKELKVSFEKFNISLNKAYASSTANQMSHINEMIKGEIYKWLLMKGKIIETSRNSGLINIKKNEFPVESLQFFLSTAIESDIEIIKSDYPGKKFSYENLSKVDKKKVDLLRPWYELVHKNEALLLFMKEHLNSLFSNLAIKLSVYALATPKLKTINDTVYFTFKMPAKDKKPTSSLPAPVQEWQDLNIYQGEKSDDVDSRGLPLPVDDWILEL